MLKESISRERIRIELEKIFRGNNVNKAIDILYSKNLWSIVFLVPHTCESI